jgi:2-isopropylmalate synthase
MTVPPRQPYAGELVFTAFSGSHQDAIKKGLAEREKAPGARWDVPYLTIDPTDIGRQYREVIRVNSQSGKGGVAYLLESEFGIELPKEMQREFGPIANDEVDRLGREVSGAELKKMFWKEYIERTAPWSLKKFETESKNGTGEMPGENDARREARGIQGRRQRPAGRAGPWLHHGRRAALLKSLNYSEHALSAARRRRPSPTSRSKPTTAGRAGARAWTRTSSWPRCARC